MCYLANLDLRLGVIIEFELGSKRRVALEALGVERERKYLVDDEWVNAFVHRVSSVIGVVQWYLEDCDGFPGIGPCRARYTVDARGRERWMVSTKGQLFADFTREEHEWVLENPPALERLSDRPVVAKLRYYLMCEPAEVVLDWFIDLDRPYNTDAKYIVEVETTGDFGEFETRFNLTNPISFEEFGRYTNERIAVRTSLAPTQIIELVKTCLLAALCRQR